MTSKNDFDPSILEAMKNLNPELFAKPAAPASTRQPNNLDGMSDEERKNASSKGGTITQRRKHAGKVASWDTVKHLSDLGRQWESELCIGADTEDTKQAIRGIVQTWFRNGVLNEDAFRMASKDAWPLELSQVSGAVCVKLIAGSEPEFVVHG